MKTLVLFFLLCANFLSAQNAAYTFTISDSKKLRNELEAAIGKDMSLRDHTIGDITADNKPDIIAIGSSKDKEQHREIYLFVCEGAKKFRLAAINSTLIECEVCGGMGVGDPYQRTVINKSYFSFELLYGACAKDFFTVTFKYDKGRKWWFLHKDVTESYNCQEADGGAITVKTEINKEKEYGVTRFENY